MTYPVKKHENIYGSDILIKGTPYVKCNDDEADMFIDFIDNDEQVILHKCGDMVQNSEGKTVQILMEDTVLSLDDKYMIVFGEHKFFCLRNGEMWRDFLGDKFVFTLMNEIISHRKKELDEMTGLFEYIKDNSYCVDQKDGEPNVTGDVFLYVDIPIDTLFHKQIDRWHQSRNRYSVYGFQYMAVGGKSIHHEEDTPSYITYTLYYSHHDNKLDGWANLCPIVTRSYDTVDVYDNPSKPDSTSFISGQGSSLKTLMPLCYKMIPKKKKA
jgi:hypothetical protein